MIPVDIDNFFITAITNKMIKKGAILIRTGQHIPKEIANCTLLTDLGLRKSDIVDISILSRCASLRVLNLKGNKIVDISAISKCTSLKFLNLRKNEIVDIYRLYQIALS